MTIDRSEVIRDCQIALVEAAEAVKLIAWAEGPNAGMAGSQLALAHGRLAAAIRAVEQAIEKSMP
jgi:hypothetical protein